MALSFLIFAASFSDAVKTVLGWFAYLAGRLAHPLDFSIFVLLILGGWWLLRLMIAKPKNPS